MFKHEYSKAYIKLPLIVFVMVKKMLICYSCSSSKCVYFTLSEFW